MFGAMAIGYEDGSTWVALSVKAARERAHNPALHINMRLLFAAVGYTNNIGHAEFEPSALRVALETYDGDTAEVVTPTAAAVSKAIKAMVLAGELEDGSCARCLILPASAWLKEGRMQDHGHAQRWCRWHCVGTKPVATADRYLRVV